MLDIFTCSDLILCIFHFLTGLPLKTKEEEVMEDFDDDDCDISSYRSSRLSMSIEGNMFQIERKFLGGGVNKEARKSDLDQIDEQVSKKFKTGNEGILNHFQFRMKQINFEMKNKETSLALRGPINSSITGLVTQSQAFTYAQDKIKESKTDNMINLLDSILRRNKDGEEVRMDDAEEPVEVQTQDINAFDELLRRKLDYFYNRQGHELGRVFYNLVQHDEEEKMNTVALKIIDNLLRS